ncbi:hypothetical protein H8E77_43610 [bacterium]|nr:hypothetical protein [bacterium]
MRTKDLNELQLERKTKFIQIPGPNPIVIGGEAGAWDEYHFVLISIWK